MDLSHYQCLNQIYNLCVHQKVKNSWRNIYIIVSRKNNNDVLYDALNNYHPKIKLTIDTNPQRFLDTEITHIDGTIETRVHRKKRKLPKERKTPFRQNYLVQREFHQILQVR